jgi:hypothetical protein
VTAYQIPSRELRILIKWVTFAPVIEDWDAQQTPPW